MRVAVEIAKTFFMSALPDRSMSPAMSTEWTNQPEIAYFQCIKFDQTARKNSRSNNIVNNISVNVNHNEPFEFHCTKMV